MTKKTKDQGPYLYPHVCKSGNDCNLCCSRDAGISNANAEACFQSQTCPVPRRRDLNIPYIFGTSYMGAHSLRNSNQFCTVIKLHVGNRTYFTRSTTNADMRSVYGIANLLVVFIKKSKFPRPYIRVLMAPHGTYIQKEERTTLFRNTAIWREDSINCDI